MISTYRASLALELTMQGLTIPNIRAILRSPGPDEVRRLVARGRRQAGLTLGERTCVYCGCTDSKACAGGCCWVEKHKATPTGVCSQCTEAMLTAARARLKRLLPHA